MIIRMSHDSDLGNLMGRCPLRAGAWFRRGPSGVRRQNTTFDACGARSKKKEKKKSDARSKKKKKQLKIKIKRVGPESWRASLSCTYMDKVFGTVE